MSYLVKFRSFNIVSRASEPHHLREALKVVGEELSHTWFGQIFREKAQSIVERATSRKTIEAVEEILDDLEEELNRRHQFKLCLISVVASFHGDTGNDDSLQCFSNEERELMAQKTEFFFKDLEIEGKRSLIHIAEKELILTVLMKCGFNRTLTARTLGISIRTLRNKLNFYRGIECYENQGAYSA